MIARLRGVLLEKSPNSVLLEVGGVGYGVTIPLSTFYELGEPGSQVALEVHTHVREDALLLFGFLTRQEKRVFERLITISGIGPKLAVTILSGLSPQALAVAVQAGDRRALQAVPGVGQKTAERVLLELRDRLHDLESAEESPSAAGHPEEEGQTEEDAVSALENLGYRPAQARETVRAVLQRRGAGVAPLTLEDLLRAALQRLTR